MNNSISRHRAWIKIIAMAVVVCQLTVDTISWAYPSSDGSASDPTTLAGRGTLQVDSFGAPMLGKFKKECNLLAFELQSLLNTQLSNVVMKRGDFEDYTNKFWILSGGQKYLVDFSFRYYF